jgi:hypothetical protein
MTSVMLFICVWLPRSTTVAEDTVKREINHHRKNIRSRPSAGAGVFPDVAGRRIESTMQTDDDVALSTRLVATFFQHSNSN